jgi:hypothetical protein
VLDLHLEGCWGLIVGYYVNEMLHRALDLVVSCKYSNKPSESEDAKFLDKLSTVELFKKDAAPAFSFISIK